MADAIDAEKRELRARLRQERAHLADRAERQARLDAHLLDLPHLNAEPARVAVFSALPDEASPQALAAHLEARGIPLAYPRVAGDALVFCEARPADLTPGAWGILEPRADAAPVALADIDLFLVPGVGFTRSGARLGYGRAFYDRALAQARRDRKAPPAPAVGVGFTVQVVPSLPVAPHDVRLDGLVTEDGYTPTQGDTPPQL
jgi:5-formyltetrahydrofolate cyclo-ligase